MPDRALSVLLLEDNVNDAELIRRELQGAGYRLTLLRAMGESDFKESIESFEPDVILADHGLPGWNGLAALELSRQRHPDVPFIFVSGTIGEELAIDSLHHGATDYVLKQRLDRLVPSVQRALLAFAERKKRLKAEAELRSSQQRLRSLVDAMEDSVFILDAERRLVGAYGGFAGHVEQIGKTLAEVYGATAPADERSIERAFAGESVFCEWSAGERQQQRHFQTRLSPIAGDKGQVTGVVGVARDITELKKIQTQLLVSDRMVSVGTLAAGVAHEINNPLSVIMADLEMAAQDVARAPSVRQEAPELEEALKDAREATLRVRDIVRDLKIFSRSEDSERRSLVDVQRVLLSTLRMAWNEVKHRCRLVKDFGPVPPVLGSESRLGQVFLNLVVNAAQAIPEGHADQNQLKVVTRTGRDGAAVIEVSDTGCGMAPETLSRLFTPFFTTKPVGEGTGLGLSICHRIVESLGGEITVESELGKGTTFTVRLPPATERTEAPGPPTPPAVQPGLRGTILAIDDEPAIAKALQRALSAHHEVVAVTSGRAALELIRAGRRFDLVICDVMMPELTGMDVYAEACEAAPELAPRFLFLTGGAFTARAREFLDRADHQRIDKPFDLERLRALVLEKLREVGVR